MKNITVSVDEDCKSSTSTRCAKQASPLTPEVAGRLIRNLLIRNPLPVSVDLMLAGAALSGRNQLSYWNAIIAAARVLQGATLYSEELGHGQTYAGVKVVNPLR